MRLIGIALLTALLHLALPAAANDQVLGGAGVITGDEVMAGVISEIERRTIEHYYGGGRDAEYEYDEYEEDEGHGKMKKNGKGKGLPPGLAKRQQLPPGLQKHLDERGTLPPGLAKRDLPPDLQASLPQRIDEELVIVDDDVVLVERATSVVLDMILGGASGD